VAVFPVCYFPPAGQGKGVADSIKYRAFLSYSHRDKAWAKWLHNALEHYRVDRDLIGRQTPVGPVPKTLRPIFLDRSDFAAGHSLNEQTIAALAASQFLIVICSPNSAQSAYVNEEVRRFKHRNQGSHIIPLIVDGEPHDAKRECFPPALRFKLNSHGEITEEPDEPLAADARTSGDGKQIAKQKTIAGLLGLPLDEIVRRTERARRRTNIFWGSVAAGFLILSVAAIGSAAYAYKQLLQSEQRLDSAIEIAYGFVAEASDLSDRYGVPIEVNVSLLKRAETALNALIKQGDVSDTLQYRRALMLLSFCDSYERLGQTDEAMSHAVEARDLLKKLVSIDPGHIDWRLALLNSRIYVGVYQARARKFSDELDTYKAGIAEAEALMQDAPGNPDVVTSLARTLANMARTQFYQGSSEEASQTYGTALRIMFKFANGSADDTNVGNAIQSQPSLEYMFNEILGSVAALHTGAGEFNEALSIRKELLAMKTSEAGRQPESASAKSELTSAFLAVGNSSLDVGELDEALQAFQSGLQLASDLSKSDPSNIAHKKLVALLQDGVGRTFLAEGQASQALETFRRNVKGGETYIEKDVGNLEWRLNLGIGHERIGDALFAQDDLAAALDEYKTAYSIIHPISDKEPEDQETRVFLAKNEMKIGEALFLLEDWSEANRFLTDALPPLVQKLTTDGKVVDYQGYAYRTAWRMSEMGGNGDALLFAKNGLELLRDHRMLDEENRRWLNQAEAAPSLALELACFGKDPQKAVQGCTDLIQLVGSNNLLRAALVYRVRADFYAVSNQRESALADYRSAIELYTQVINSDPQEALIYNNRGLVYASLRNFELAIADFNKSIELDPNLAIAYSNRGVAYENLGKLDQAIGDYNVAIKLDGKVALSYANRGNCYVELGSRDKAIADYDAAIRLNATDGRVYDLRGVAFFRKGSLDQALSDFTRAIELNAFDALAFTNRGRVYERQGIFDKAISDHNSALQINPSFAMAYANRGLANEGKGQFDLARQDFERALSIDPTLDRAIEGRKRMEQSNISSR
jgi:tetratricopeptide (TPR) repeat protein